MTGGPTAEPQTHTPAKGGSRSRPPPIDLAEQSGSIGLERVGKEVDLKDVWPLHAIKLQNDHRIDLIRACTVAATAIILCTGVSVAFVSSDAKGRSDLLHEFFPYFTPLLAFGDGAGAVASVRKR